MEKTIQIVKDAKGHKIVILPEVIFKNRQNIDWKAVEVYLQKYVGEMVMVQETGDIVFIGSEFPDEYKGSKYTIRLKGAIAKAKANASQGIKELLAIATNRRFYENQKRKHAYKARKGWYYYTTRFALPIYENDKKTEFYNVYSASLLVKHSGNNKKYIYDLVDIKREASTPLQITEVNKW